MQLRSGIVLAVYAIVLAGCTGCSGPSIITEEFEGRDCGYYHVDGNWLVYGWSPPGNLGRPIHMVARDLTTGTETELEGDWHGHGIDLEDGILVYAKRAGDGEVNLVVYDLQANTRTSFYRGQVSGLDVSGSTVVWGARDATDSRVIAIGTIYGGTVRLIQDAARPKSATDTHARVSGNRVVFCRRDLSTNVYTLMVHDLNSGTTEALPITLYSNCGFDLSGDTIVYRKKDDKAFYVMNLSDRKERWLVDVPYLSEGPVLNGNTVAWVSHMPPEEFKGMAGQPLIDHRDFRDLNVIKIDSSKQKTLISERFGLRSVSITDDKRIFVLLPREVTASPSRITDIIQF